MSVAHSVIPAPGQEREGERIDYFHFCRCRVEQVQRVMFPLVQGEIRPIQVVKVCPPLSVMLKGAPWKERAGYQPCERCEGWSEEWLGWFIPADAPQDYRPIAAERGIELNFEQMYCGNCGMRPSE